MTTVRVETRPRPYDVVVGDGELERLGSLVRATCAAARLVIVTDRTVAGLYLDRVSGTMEQTGADVSHVVLPPGEAQKTLARAEELYGVLYERKMTRADAVLALGGGVIGDLAGFVAATYLRGLSLVQVPTTLLAQVDAAVGGKVGVDFRRGKNHVGTFYQPRLVVADVATLRTLPANERRNGAAEVVKYAFLNGGDLLERVEAALSSPDEPASDPLAVCAADIVAECVAYKAAVVAADEREETGERHLLNLGHTIGHAIEAAGGFARYSHGESVGLGLSAMLWLSHRVSGLSGTDVERGERLLAASGAPSRLDDIDPRTVADLVRRDKKAVGDAVPFVLLEGMGRPARGVQVSPALIREVIAWLAAR